MRFIVVTGTDTGVGKTFVSVAVTRALVASMPSMSSDARERSRVLALKPLESGCAEAVHEDEDGVRLARASGQASPLHALQRLRAAVTPALAADLEGVNVDVMGLCDRVRALGAQADVVLVEGAGGLLSPLSWAHDLVDVAAALDAPVLVVGADRLGVLHHVRALAAVLAAKARPLLGVVLSAPEVPDASTGTNVDALERLGVLPRERMATFRRLPSDDPAIVAAATRVATWVLRLP